MAALKLIFACVKEKLSLSRVSLVITDYHFFSLMKQAHLFQCIQTILHCSSLEAPNALFLHLWKPLEMEERVIEKIPFCLSSARGCPTQSKEKSRLIMQNNHE